MKQIPTPQLIRISDPALVPVVKPDRSEALWEEFLRVQLKPRTRQEYRKAIAYFCQAIAPHRSPTVFLAEFLALSKAQAILKVLEYRQELVDAGLSTATINLRLSAIKSLVKYAAKRNACGFSLDDIGALKSQPYRDTRGVSVEDYRSVISLVDRTTDLGRRDYAILRLLWDNALRREEVVSLDLADYDRQEGRLMIMGKGKIDQDAIDINSPVREALDEWIAFRAGLMFAPKDGSERDSALFLSCNGRRLCGTDIRRILQRYAEKVGVRLSPHKVRHSSITAFLDASEGNVRAAQALSRHGDIKTLMIYDDNRHGLQKMATEQLGDLLVLDNDEIGHGLKKTVTTKLTIITTMI